MESPNVIHGVADPDSSYVTTNLAEAMPGVASPLGWSFWGPAGELASRAPWHALGALAKHELESPSEPGKLNINVFYGRIAARVNFLAEVGDRLPGSNGIDVARDAYGVVPEAFVSRPTKRRYPIVAMKMPTSFLGVPRISKGMAETESWWRAEVGRTPTRGQAQAIAQLIDAERRFSDNLSKQSVLIVCGIMPAFTGLAKLATSVDVDPNDLMRGHGSHRETAMIEDLWSLSRERIGLADFLRRHGFHGPNVGEISNHSWREDPSPLKPIVDGYRRRSDDADPARTALERSRQREAAERDLLSRLPRTRRPTGRLVLSVARRYLPLRAAGKVAFLQSLDTGRAAARRIGTLLAGQGVLADPDDVFYLTLRELSGPVPADVDALVAERKALRERYRSLELPVSWRGVPEAKPIAAVETSERLVLEGLGVSPGVVEGAVRVIEDPADAKIEDGEVLVAHTTDPSWASMMFLASALVVDIGGMLSHAAVVARELGIPCVMNTQTGTRVLRTGDRVRVDGARGLVEVSTGADA